MEKHFFDKQISYFVANRYCGGPSGFLSMLVTMITNSEKVEIKMSGTGQESLHRRGSWKECRVWIPFLCPKLCPDPISQPTFAQILVQFLFFFVFDSHSHSPKSDFPREKIGNPSSHFSPSGPSQMGLMVVQSCYSFPDGMTPPEGMLVHLPEFYQSGAVFPALIRRYSAHFIPGFREQHFCFD